MLTARANCVENDDDNGSIHSVGDHKEGNSNMSKLIQLEIAKYDSTYMQQQGHITMGDVNMVQESQARETPFDGHYAFNVLSSMEKTAWVIDSGANTHICSTPELFSCTYMLSKPAVVHLPDGSSKTVTSVGKVRINKDLLLVDVLYILGFTNNLLSVGRLIHDYGIKCTFYKDHCMFQKDFSDKLL